MHDIKEELLDGARMLTYGDAKATIRDGKAEFTVAGIDLETIMPGDAKDALQNLSVRWWLRVFTDEQLRDGVMIIEEALKRL